MATQTITPTGATEKLGDVIAVDINDLKKLLMHFKNQVDQVCTVSVYGSHIGDSTMASKVLVTSFMMAAGNVTPTTAGFDTEVPYSYWRVGVTPAGGPTGNFTLTYEAVEEL